MCWIVCSYRGRCAQRPRPSTKPKTFALRSARARSGRQDRSDDPPVRETLTLSQLLALYRKRCLLPRLFPGGEVLTDPGAARERELLSKADSQIRIISRTELDRPDGERRAMGAWLVCDVTTDTIEQFQAVRKRQDVGRRESRPRPSSGDVQLGRPQKAGHGDTFQDRDGASHQAAQGGPFRTHG